MEMERENLMSDLIEIDEEGEIDIEAIMQQIRAYIVSRRAAADDRWAESLARFNGRLAPDLYEAAYQMMMTYDQMRVAESLTRTSIPVVGRLWMAVRRQLHTLVLFYVNQLAAKQIDFNRHLVAVLSEIVKELETLPTAAEVVELRQEIERLRGETSGPARDREGE